MNIPRLEVIGSNQQLNYLISLKEMIEERKILKPQVKLLHIYYLDQDLITLNKSNLTLSDIDLESIYLTKYYQLYVPLKERITEQKENNYIKLKSYLIYLSYLYNINLLEIYDKNPNYLYSLIFSLNIDESIKQNLFNLLNNKYGDYFSKNIEKLNNAEYRENLHNDELRLVRKFKHNVN